MLYVILNGIIGLFEPRFALESSEFPDVVVKYSALILTSEVYDAKASR